MIEKANCQCGDSFIGKSGVTCPECKNRGAHGDWCVHDTHQKKLKFPMSFTKCPACGSEIRLVETAMKENLQPAQKTTMHMFGVALTDQVGAVILPTVPVLMIFTDVCVVCGCLYVTHVEKMVGRAQRPGPPGQEIPFTGRG